MYFEMPALRRGKISAHNMPFNYTSNVGSGLYGLAGRGSIIRLGVGSGSEFRLGG
jgi:hypothetical protein